MPELPDISAYITALQARILGQPLEKVRLNSVFLLRTVEPSLSSAEGRVVREIRRVGKRTTIFHPKDRSLRTLGCFHPNHGNPSSRTPDCCG
jgi:formamidopyrimidine-DNA glycosylase